MPSHQFTVGQQLYFVSSCNRPTEYHVNVTKVGRKWVYLSNHKRFDQTRRSQFANNCWFCDGDGYASPGSVYLTIFDHQDERRRSKLIDALATFFRPYRITPSESMTADRLAYVARLLGIKIDGELPTTKEFICEKCGLRTDAKNNTEPTF